MSSGNGVIADMRQTFSVLNLPQLFDDSNASHIGWINDDLFSEILTTACSTSQSGANIPFCLLFFAVFL
jgi:hypothetical protein